MRSKQNKNWQLLFMKPKKGKVEQKNKIKPVVCSMTDGVAYDQCQSMPCKDLGFRRLKLLLGERSVVPVHAT